MTEVGRELDRRDRRRIAPAVLRRRDRIEPQHEPGDEHRPDERRFDDRIGHGWTIATAAAWIAGIGLILLLEPAPADPAATSLVGEIIGTVVAMGLSVTMLGLVTRYRFGLAAAAATGGMMMAVSIACPVSGHHAFGAWWIGELAIVAGLTALGVFGYRRATGTGE